MPELPELPEFPGLQKWLAFLRRATNPSNLVNPGNPATRPTWETRATWATRANLALLVAQRRDRIDPGRAAGGPEGGEHADEREEDGDADVGDRVERIDLEQQRPQHAGSKRREHEAGQQSDDHEQHRLPHDQRAKLMAAGAQREPDAVSFVRIVVR